MNWLLIVALVLIGGGAFFGWRAGFVKTVFSLVSTIAVIIITLMFSPVVTELLKNNETITGVISEGMESIVDLSGLQETIGSSIDVEALIDGLELPDSIKNVIKDSFADALEAQEEEATELVGAQTEKLEAYICDRLTDIILNAVGFFATFLLAAVGMAVLCFVLDLISKLPVLHQINTLAGVAVGALEGLVILWIVFIVITMLGSTEFGQSALAQISESRVLSILYDTNILSKILNA